MELDRRGFIRLTATGAAAVLLDACTPAAPGAKPTAALVAVKRMNPRRFKSMLSLGLLAQS